MASTTFGPEGTVFSSTVLHIPTEGRTGPTILAYVDLDNGPRLLAHVVDSSVGCEPLPGSRTCLVGYTQQGDPAVTAIDSSTGGSSNV